MLQSLADFSATEEVWSCAARTGAFFHMWNWPERLGWVVLGWGGVGWEVNNLLIVRLGAAFCSDLPVNFMRPQHHVWAG